MAPNKGNGKGANFLKGLIGHQGDECVRWPYSLDGHVGRGRLGYLGKMYWAHILMCELAHGDKPSEAHEVAHTCGKGHEACVNPNHLAWKTRSQNQLDRAKHGTKALGGYKHARRKLNAEKVATIKALKGIETQCALAARFEVTDATIRDIYRGKTWKHVA